MSSPKFLPVETLNSLVLGGLKEPVVFKQYLRNDKSSKNLESWQMLSWNIDKWADVLQDNKLKVRLGHRKSESSEPQWEGTCYSSHMTFNELFTWSKGKSKCHTSCGKELSSEYYWAYYDYVYMKDEINLDVLKQKVSWDIFGFPKRGANDSSIWIGTTNAHTPCHKDTYGCNLVAQVYGNKQWTLFPPDQTQCLYPTRIPYEESSIYSKIDFTNLDITRFPKMKNSTPLVVTLQPGDVLFVPKHWWHFVENLNFSISINTWIELPSDTEDQLKEALVVHQVGSACQATDSTEIISSILNPNMLHIATMTASEIFDCVQDRIEQYRKSQDSHRTKPYSDLSSKELVSNIHEHETSIVDWVQLSSCNVERIKQLTFSEYLSLRKPDNSLIKAANENLSKIGVDTCAINLKLLLSSLTDPRVVDVLTEVMLEKMTSLDITQ
uniref:HSPB1-associated protein 1-like n=1 Tax=Hirondellea gigas TaxID=1518452 RepID=A0A6A7G1N8_9CRUS